MSENDVIKELAVKSANIVYYRALEGTFNQSDINNISNQLNSIR